MKRSNMKAQPKTVRPVPRSNSPQKQSKPRTPSHVDSFSRQPVKKAYGRGAMPTLEPMQKPQTPIARPTDKRTTPVPTKAPPEAKPKEVKIVTKAVTKSADPPEHHYLSEPLPEFESPTFHDAFMAKMKVCKILSPFVNIQEEITQIEIKLVALRHLYQLLMEKPETMTCLTGAEINELFDMIKVNLFRKFRELPAVDLFYEVPPMTYDPMWPHLELVYAVNFRLYCMASEDKRFDEEFMESMFKLFASAFPNERVELVHFFKGVIIKAPERRMYVVDKIMTMVKQHLTSQDRPFHVAAAVPILVSICEREDEECDKLYQLVKEYVLPLIGDTFVFYFSVQMEMILDFYTDESPERALEVVERILKCWPRQNTAKMTVYTAMVIEHSSRMDPDAQDRILPRMFKLLADNCTAPSPKLAEASFQIFLAPNFDELMNRNCETIMKIMVPRVLECVSQHWESSVRDIALLCMSIMDRFHPKLMKQLATSVSCTDEGNGALWSSVAATAAENDPSLPLVDVANSIHTLFGVSGDPTSAEEGGESGATVESATDAPE